MISDKSCIIEQFTKVSMTLISVIGVIDIFFSDVISIDSFWMGLIIFLGVLFLAVIITLLLNKHTTGLKRKVLYAKEKTEIIIEYGDYLKLFDNPSVTKKTVVIPICTNMELNFDRSIIKGRNSHALFLNYYSQKKNEEFSFEKLKSVGTKKDNYSNTGKIGDWFCAKATELGLDCKCDFLFFEMFDLELKDGVYKYRETKKEDYMKSLQLLIETIRKAVPYEEDVYIPLIGAGDSNIGKAVDVACIIKELLIFNKDKLRHKVHIVVHERKNQPVKIYQMNSYQQKKYK